MRFMRRHIWMRHSQRAVDPCTNKMVRGPPHYRTPELYVWVRGLTTRLSYEWVISRKNERVMSHLGFPKPFISAGIHNAPIIRMSHVTYERTRHITCGIPHHFLVGVFTTRLLCEWIMSYINGCLVFYTNESRTNNMNESSRVWMGRVTYGWVMSHMHGSRMNNRNESCHI